MLQFADAESCGEAVATVPTVPAILALAVSELCHGNLEVFVQTDSELLKAGRFVFYAKVTVVE